MTRPDQPGRRDRLLTTAEAADFLRVDAKTVKRWVDAGKLRGIRTPGGHIRVPESALRQLLEAGRTDTGGSESATGGRS